VLLYEIVVRFWGTHLESYSTKGHNIGIWMLNPSKVKWAFFGVLLEGLSCRIYSASRSRGAHV